MGPKKDAKGGKGKGKDASDGDDKGKGGKGLKPANSINVRHILCEKHSKKEEALEKLRNGAKFDDVAREFSEDKARQGTLYTGGSLGWKVRGSLHGDFEKVAYELEPSTTGNPKYAEVKTGFGYHIIMVEGRK
ncbi:Peptidyl-prolyl cis-trans isomerase pin4 [Talaromyces atroroseus]|uniref:Peptidyl-prolyl cis-trans isomerase n=1 Tax=Talaromyces atroroseus TaxID=1441469 RepID=A0A1Q5Q868_TALAT|nr:Peptidyl-prolyl cis-trans isomerase pin4 [Talaromyces atroroseus]OKL60326.1 Peptidyl-prolyl cis-trans isomerase pin4 [Talaromyces atroroseus]